ncbi:hypothetical protein AURDEDRAFT_113118 [Auricularia subglabra TFB-10046 SS5]|nr:hypothetical protein AURDEDRAFT_113118 [Auricularia subglabra TFB-10046 SS5]
MPKLPSTCLFWLGLLAPAFALAPAQRCAEFARTHIHNARSVTTLYLTANSSYRVPASCGMGLADDLLAQTSVNVCVVNVVYNTSQTSATRIEAWLPDPDAWYGRILGTGGGGLGGCVDYDNLKRGPSLHLATFGHDGGHDGASGAAFACADEIVADWAHRALHVAADTTKLLVLAYYGHEHDLIPGMKHCYAGPGVWRVAVRPSRLHSLVQLLQLERAAHARGLG